MRLKEYRLRDSVDVLLSNCLKMSQEAQQRESKLPIKVVIVGDGSVGKTCLAQTFVHNAFPDDYTPTVFENMNKNMVVDGQVKAWHFSPPSGPDIFKICFMSTLCVVLNFLDQLLYIKWPLVNLYI